MTALSTEKKERLTHLDILRTFATVAVITLHVGNGGGYSGDSVVRTLVSILNEWCVPVFVMLTGILFLESGKDLSFNAHGKRILRLLITLLFWTFFYNIVSTMLIDRQFSLTALKNAFFMTLTADTTYGFQFWYLYMAIGLYLLLPVLNAFLKSLSDKEQLIALHVVILFSLIIPTVQSIVGTGGSIWKSGFTYFSGFVVYLLLGHRLEKHPVKKPFFIVTLLTSAVWVGLIVFFAIRGSDYAEKIGGYLSVVTAELTILIFCLGKAIAGFVDGRPMLRKIFAFTAKYSLPVYVLHVIIVQMLRKLIGFDSTFAPLYISIPVLTLIVYCISLFAGWLLKKIPLLKNTL